jgi:hypothetical protein
MTQMLAEAPPDYIVCEATWGSAAHGLLIEKGYQSKRLCGEQDYGNMLYTFVKSAP